MKKLILFALIFASITRISAQTNPISWSYEAKKINDTEYDICMTAKCDVGWYIYSQYLESDNGPIATSFAFNPDEKVSLVGKITENGHKKEGYDDMFGMNIIKFSENVVFTQRVKVTGKVQSINGIVTYMTCNNEKCLPPKDIPFSIVLP